MGKGRTISEFDVRYIIELTFPTPVRVEIKSIAIVRLGVDWSLDVWSGLLWYGQGLKDGVRQAPLILFGFSLEPLDFVEFYLRSLPRFWLVHSACPFVCLSS